MHCNLLYLKNPFSFLSRSSRSFKMAVQKPKLDWTNLFEACPDIAEDIVKTLNLESALTCTWDHLLKKLYFKFLVLKGQFSASFSDIFGAFLGFFLEICKIRFFGVLSC